MAEGEKLAAEILAMGIPIHTLCATADWFEKHSGNPEIQASCPSATEHSNIQTFSITDEQLQRLSSLRQPNKVWMLLDRTAVSTVNCQPSTPLTLVLDHIQDPGNLGTVIRTADWFGIRQIICSPDTVSCFNPKVVQSTMGSLFRVRVSYCDLHEWLSRCGMPVYGAVLDGINLRQAALSTPAALVIGNESRGISPEIRPLLTNCIAIPNIGGTCESLNAAVATAILVSKFVI